jgi:O-antigen/teichoic acid export membrane protein
MKAVQRVAKNTTLLFAARIIDNLAGLILIAMLTRFLGFELYGRYAWILAWVTLFQPVINFELDKILIREVSSDHSAAGKYMGNVLMIKWCLLTVVFGALALYVYGSDLPPMIKYAFYFIIFSEAFYHHAMVFLAVFNAFERMEYDAMLTLVFRGLSLLLIGLTIVTGRHYILVFVALAISNLMRTALGGFIAFRKFGRPVFKPDFALWRYLLGQAYFLSIASFIAVGMFRIDIFLLPKTWLGGSYSWVAMFQVPHSLILQLQIVPFAFGCALFPLMSRCGRDDREGLRDLYRDAFRLLFLISIPITFLLIFFAPLIIRIMCPEVAQQSVHTLMILAVSVIPLFFHALFSNVLISIKKQKGVLLASIAGFVINAVMDILLIPSWGPVGAAMGKICAYLLVSIGLYFYVTRELGRLHLASIILKPLLAGLAAGVVLYAARDYNLYVVGLAGCASYVLFLFLLRSFTQRDRDMVRAMMGKGGYDF